MLSLVPALTFASFTGDDLRETNKGKVVHVSARNGREFNTARVRSILKAIGSVERKGSVTFNLDPPKIGSPRNEFS